MGLSYTVDRFDDTRRVRLSGEIDMHVASEAINVIADSVLDGAPKRVVVDLGQVSMLDSTGVAALLTAQTIAAQRGCTLVAANPASNVRELLAVTGVLDTLTGVKPPSSPRPDAASDPPPRGLGG